jgi:hypothetical protein
MPLWWQYPEAVRKAMIDRWERRLPAWTEMVKGTTFVTEQELRELFPACNIRKEWLLFPKSLIAFNNVSDSGSPDHR